MSARDAVRHYLGKIEHEYRPGTGTEHTYRPMLKELLEVLIPHITATNEPKRVACGAPDFVVARTERHGPLTIGYVEAKDIGVSLGEMERSDQLKRYRANLSNLVLTDYLEFRWYVNGEHRLSARLVTVGADRKVIPDLAATERVIEVLQSFLTFSPEPIRSPQELAARMARIAHLIRELTFSTLQVDKPGDDGHPVVDAETLRGILPTLRTLHDLHQTFAQVLIPGLAESDFADMFAQTLAYGLFAARCNHQGPAPFTRRDAVREIPRTNPFLRHLFELVTGSDLDDAPFGGFVDDLAQLLAHTDMERVLADFGKRTRTEDPIVHFYETFLQAYDPKVRELRGVYYTPEPVVSYIVRSVDTILRRDFHCVAGLAETAKIEMMRSDDGRERIVRSPRVLILDPACGTGTFLYEVVNHIREAYQRSGNAGMWSSYVREHLLPRIFGFELLMAPYAVAHLKLGMQLAGFDLPVDERRQWVYDFATHERLGVYLTNTLEEAEKRSERLKLGGFISDEANAAATIKRDDPVMVVLGNPPYSGHSANKGSWISGLIDTYKEGCPELKKPGQAKWLSDDYVKFIRFGQWRIERRGYGILAFITNHSYLDNPTFRGMRRSLMRSFDEIYVLNLHGNSKKKELAPDGSKDENVFDIQQGVAISLFVRRAREAGAERNAVVRYADLWGLREGKYAFLGDHDVTDTSWSILQPQESFYLFAPQDTAYLAEYEAGWKIPDIFSPNGDPAPGIVTTHDEFAISWDKAEAIRKVESLLATKTEDEARQLFRLCSQDQWRYAWAKKELADGKWRQEAVQVLYRPFDIRWTIFNSNVAVHRRERVMRHMLAGENLALITSRMTKGESFQHAQASRNIVEVICMSPNTSNNGFVFPLFYYPDPAKPHLVEDESPSSAPGGRRPNLAPAFILDFTTRLGLAWLPDGKGDRERTVGPEDVFAYVYAILHAPTYRQRYAEFLKIDFPRVPLTSNAELFRTG